MKKSAIFIMIFMAFIFTGCNFQSAVHPTKEQFVTYADSLYLDIKTIVTDPAIRPAISKDVMDKLKEAEDLYLEAKAVQDTVSQEPIDLLISAGKKVLEVTNILVLNEKQKAIVAGIRLSIKMLLNKAPLVS